MLRPVASATGTTQPLARWWHGVGRSSYTGTAGGPLLGTQSRNKPATNPQFEFGQLGRTSPDFRAFLLDVNGCRWFSPVHSARIAGWYGTGGEASLSKHWWSPVISPVIRFRSWTVTVPGILPQWIGLRENLNRKPSIFPLKNWGLNL